MENIIRDIYPMKAQYLPADPVEVMLELTRPAPAGLTVAITVSALRETVFSFQACIDEGAESHRCALAPMREDFRGYGVRAEAFAGSKPAGTMWTAFDTVSDYRNAPRYGFLSDFFGEKGNDNADITCMLKLHLNLVQFYDWMYRHETLLADTAIYTDIMGKKSDLGLIRRKLDLCNAAGMKAMAYGAVYAASEAFYREHADWALAYPDGSPVTFIGRLYIMDITAGSPWRTHILEQFKKAVSFGFDGIHMDTYGYPKAAYRPAGAKQERFSLADEFPSLIDENSRNLRQIKPASSVIFNNVGNWPVERTASSATDAVYVEVWDPYSRYVHIRNIIMNAQKAGGGKPVILAAYLKPFRELGADNPGAEQACLYLTSAIFAHGAGHLLMGEERAALTQGYYSDYSVLSETFFDRIRKYYDFDVRYLDVLHDGMLEDVSETHAHGDNMEYRFFGARFSADGSPGTVWAIIRESMRRKVISLINLSACTDDLWNAPKEAPATGLEYRLDIEMYGKPKRVLRASPERRGGEACQADYTMENAERGLRLKVDVSDAALWEMLIIEC